MALVEPSDGPSRCNHSQSGEWGGFKHPSAPPVGEEWRGEGARWADGYKINKTGEEEGKGEKKSWDESCDIYMSFQ